MTHHAGAIQMSFDLEHSSEVYDSVRALSHQSACARLDIETVEQATGLAVQVIVDSVGAEIAAIAEHAGQSRDRCYAILREVSSEKAFEYVSARTSALYASERGRRGLKSSDPRGYLYSFVRHWLSGYLNQVDSAAYGLLPTEFKVGHPVASRETISST